MRTLGAEGLDVLSADCRDKVAWEQRIARDRARSTALLAPALRQATELVVSRALAGGARAVALTGSTVRGRRTDISDLDFHVVGPRPMLTDVDVDVDVYATSADVLFDRLRVGDDYVQWTLRFGCVLFDSGVLHTAASELVASGMWPSPTRKIEQARRMLDLARLVVASGDRDAAIEQVRSAITALARWLLLANGAFPLSRGELPDQLRVVGAADLAAVLDRCISSQPSMDELSAGVTLAGRAVSAGELSRTA